jgi:hypothetical protein
MAETLTWFARQAHAQQPSEFWRNRREIDLLPQNGCQRFCHRTGAEQRSSGQHFVDDNAEGPRCP